MVAGLTVGAAPRSKSARRLMRGKRASLMRLGPAAFAAFVELGGKNLGQKSQVAHLGALGDLGEAAGVGADHRQAELPGGGPDSGGRGGVGHHGGHLGLQQLVVDGDARERAGRSGSALRR